VSLPLLPLLSGDDSADLQTLYKWIYDLIRYFPNAVGTAIDPTQGQGGDASLTVTEAPTNITYTPSSSLSVDGTIFGAIDITYTLPDRAVDIVAYYKETSDINFKQSYASTSPFRLTSLKVGTQYSIQLAGRSANNSIGPLSPLTNITIPTSILPTFTPGSVMFTGTNGLPAQDNANLFYDDINNRLGVGTNSPLTQLEVSGSVANDAVTMSMNNNNTTGFSSLRIKEAESDTKLLIIDYLNSAFGAVGVLLANMGVIFTHTGATNGFGFGTLANAPITFFTNGLFSSERMRITGAGNVGIGTVSPAVSALLELASTTGALLITRLTTTQRDALTPVDGMIIYNSTTSKLQGYEASAWRDIKGAPDTGWSTSGTAADKVLVSGDTLAATQDVLGTLITTLIAKGILAA